MPRRSAHKVCVDCGQPLEMGVAVLTTFYVVGCRSNDQQRRKQIKGTVANHGYCVECFLKLAKAQGLNKADRLELRQKLEPGRDTECRQSTSVHHTGNRDRRDARVGPGTMNNRTREAMTRLQECSSP